MQKNDKCYWDALVEKMRGEIYSVFTVSSSKGFRLSKLYVLDTWL